MCFTDLSHGSKETLRVEEASHPEHIGSTIETPRVELRVLLYQLREPET